MSTFSITQSTQDPDEPKKGYISWPQLLRALEIQIEENTEKGEDRFIGDVLCDLNFMTKLQVRDVFESMEEATTKNE